ncbi:lactose-binding lectin l-2 [Pleuronectes platessa]|uniref:lactose-binding lectin l-2-like n=1 Tax=Pleuronectes platessa TaxID=8262 RepID=UPI00232A3C22|nr:lactose-binding lectin l-2-like [Pleuronectes platessa]XP_053303470.1 lactose-binding lectin l-2 [Pleuronectes platessa]
MILLLLLFTLTLGAVSPSDGPEVRLQRGNCPMFWFSFNNRCYKYVATEQSWADAEFHCVSQGTNLVSIHSLEEENFITALIKNFDLNEGITWNGLNDLYKEGSWIWSDGCAVKFTFWSTGQPDNYLEMENCGHNNFSTEKKWNDIPCSNIYPSVCASRIMCPQ